MRRAVWLLALLTLFPSFNACGDQVELGVDNVRGGIGDDGGSCEVAKCQRSIYDCGNCLDDDGDGLVDGLDPDCLGPCDDTEDSYYGGIPGQNNAPCVQDCYFDQDTGAGNDGCSWSHACDPLSIGPAFPPSGDDRCTFDDTWTNPATNQGCSELAQVQAESCLAYCKPLTPNGCDCFGCCELPAGSGRFVWLGSTDNGVGSCHRDTVDDPTLCRPCTPVPSCFNGCSDCELCVGKDAPGVSCPPSTPNEPGQCPPAREPCGLRGQDPCPAGQYCITGCCVDAPT